MHSDEFSLAAPMSSGELLDDARALRTLSSRLLSDVEKLRPPPPSGLSASAGSVPAANGGVEPVTEEALVACKDVLSTAKHRLIDLQTRKSLAAALASDRPFALLDANAAAGKSNYVIIQACFENPKRIFPPPCPSTPNRSNGLC